MSNNYFFVWKKAKLTKNIKRQQFFYGFINACVQIKQRLSIDTFLNYSKVYKSSFIHKLIFKNL